MTLIISIITGILLMGVAFGVFSAILFYHIGKYSLVGDLSKRMFVYYIVFSISVSLAGTILIIINHLVL